MADPLVIHSDLELHLTTWYRAALSARSEPVCAGVVVSNREPAGTPKDPFPKRLVVIRDDGGPDTSLLTATRSVGISVFAGTQENPADAIQLALIVHALRNQIPSTDPSNPVAALLGSNGPYPVSDAQPIARRYLTLSLAVVARAL